MFDTTTRTLLWTARLPGDNFLPTLVFWPDQQILTATGSFDLKQWDAQTGKFLRVLPLSHPFDRFTLAPDKVTLLVMAPVESQRSGCSGEARLELRDARTGQHTRILERTCISSDRVFSPDSQTLVMANNLNETVSLWSVKTGKLLRKLATHGIVRDIAFTSGSKTLAGVEVGKTSSSVVFWDSHTGQRVHTLPTQSHTLCRLIASPDGSTLAGIDGGTGNILVWDGATGKVLRALSGALSSQPALNREYVSPAFTSDGSRLAIVRTDGTILLQRVK